jgi:hypothetical protein
MQASKVGDVSRLLLQQVFAALYANGRIVRANSE